MTPSLDTLLGPITSFEPFTSTYIRSAFLKYLFDSILILELQSNLKFPFALDSSKRETVSERYPFSQSDELG